MHLRALLLVSLFSGMTAFIASAQDESAISAKKEDSVEAAVTVRMIGNQFVPNVIEIRRGQAIVWENASLDTHTVTDDPGAARFADDASLPEGAEPFNSGPLGLGQSYRRTFDIPGVYRYFCTLHEGQRMVGTIIVKSPDVD